MKISKDFVERSYSDYNAITAENIAHDETRSISEEAKSLKIDDITITSGIFISNAGESTCNGMYEYAGVLSGKPYYTFKNYRLVWNASNYRWELQSVAPNNIYYYNDTSTDLSKPYYDLNWTVGASGTAPSPTLSESDKSVKIKEIDYIIDDTNQSIDGSNTPQNDAHRELATRAYIDNVIATGGFWISGSSGNNSIRTAANAATGGDATGDYSVAQGSNTKATNFWATAEGTGTIASGEGSHAEGENTRANGNGSHSEGRSAIADGNASHAEGQATKSQGGASHAEGYNTTAQSNFSHAEGYNTIAQNTYQHSAGMYNVGTDSDTIHETGIGTSSSNKLNAFEIYKDGSLVSPENTIALINSKGNRAIVTKEYVDSSIISSNLWTKTGTRLEPSDVLVDNIVIEKNHNGYNIITLENINTENGAGAVFEAHKSNTDYQDNIYVGIYSDNFWIPTLAGNGALFTDQNLVIGTVDDTKSINFLVGNSYTSPVVVGHLNQNGLYLDTIKITSTHPASYHNLFVDASSGLIYASSTGTTGDIPQTDRIVVDSTLESNKTFTLTRTHNVDRQIYVYQNGLLLEDDYEWTLSSNTITFTESMTPLTIGDRIVIKYYH